MKFSSFLQGRTVVDNGFRELMPRVSVIMPTYCRMAEGFLAQCIDSVLAQSFTDFEFIIVDDGSVDGSEHLIRDYAGRDRRIVYVRHDINSGLPAVRTNEGILLARAPFVTFIFDDNIWIPTALETLFQAAMESEADIVHANVEMKTDDASFVLGQWPATSQLLQHLNTIPNGAVLCRNSLFNTYGLYDPHIIIRRTCDWDLWLRALKQGASFYHVDEVLGLEQGIVSEVSIGRSVQWDYKVMYAYMTDTNAVSRRVNDLLPANIGEYDVFDAEKVFPYIVSYEEWDLVEETIYKPYFEKHKQYDFILPARHNQRYLSGDNVASLNYTHNMFHDRRRILIVSNRYTFMVREWCAALESYFNAIVLSCSEWGISGFQPADIDLLLLFDCTGMFIKNYVYQFRNAGVPVGYCMFTRHDEIDKITGSPLDYIDYRHCEYIHKLFGFEVCFPYPGLPLSGSNKNGAESIMKASSRIYSFSTDNAHDKSTMGTQIVLAQNAVSRTSKEIEKFCLFLGNVSRLSETSADLVANLTSIPAFKKWEVVVCQTSCAESFHQRDGVLSVRRTNESLSSFAADKRQTLIIVPDELLACYSDVVRTWLEEVIARNGSAVVPLSCYLLVRSLNDFTAVTRKTVERFRDEVITRGQNCHKDARSLQFANIAYALMFQHQMQSHVPDRSNRIGIFLNSPMLSGSEVYGLLLLEGLRSLGIDAVAVYPEKHLYGHDADPQSIHSWLNKRDLPRALEAPYGNDFLKMSVSSQKKAVKELRAWLEKERCSSIICSGLIPEAARCGGGDLLVYMALFQPFAYPLDQMVFLRECSFGFMSDCDWSSNYWSRFLPPPVKTVRTFIDNGYFGLKNADLPLSPICVAVGGTLQPRKRQKEAILAIAELCAKGHDIYLNIYGYELEMLKDYTEEIRNLAHEKLAGRVQFKGLVDIEIISRENHIFLMTSIDESMPQTLLYMLAGGVIAVCCPSGGISEVIHDGETGFLTQGFDVQDIVKGMERAIRERTSWGVMASHARDLLIARYSREIVMRNLLQILYDGARIYLAKDNSAFPFRPYAKKKHKKMQATTDTGKRILAQQLTKLLKIGPVHRIYARVRHLDLVQRLIGYIR